MKDADFDGIMQGLREARDHLQGKGVAGMVVHIPSDLEVARIRGRTGLSQPHFAQRIGVSVSTLRNWEQGRRVPEGPARVLLAMLDRNPGIVAEVLGAAGPRSEPARRPARQRGPTGAPARPLRSKAQG
jgi:putative transcriptional regulator